MNYRNKFCMFLPSFFIRYSNSISAFLILFPLLLSRELYNSIDNNTIITNKNPVNPFLLFLGIETVSLIVFSVFTLLFALILRKIYTNTIVTENKKIKEKIPVTIFSFSGELFNSVNPHKEKNIIAGKMINHLKKGMMIILKIALGYDILVFSFIQPPINVGDIRYNTV